LTRRAVIEYLLKNYRRNLYLIVQVYGRLAGRLAMVWPFSEFRGRILIFVSLSSLIALATVQRGKQGLNISRLKSVRNKDRPLLQGFAYAQANARKLAYKEPDRGQALLDSGAVPVN
jgi:hypothetical protein